MKTNRRRIRIIVALITFLVLSNYSNLFRLYVVFWFAPEDTLMFNYTTLHGEFKVHEGVRWKTGFMTYASSMNHFERFKQCYPTSTDTVLHRMFKKDIWQFWNWFIFFTHPRYKFPYMNPAIEPRHPNKLPPTLCPGVF